jgi:hypothetical protein
MMPPFGSARIMRDLRAERLDGCQSRAFRRPGPEGGSSTGTAETDWLAEEVGFEPLVPLAKKSPLVAKGNAEAGSGQSGEA